MVNFRNFFSVHMSRDVEHAQVFTDVPTCWTKGLLWFFGFSKNHLKPLETMLDV